MSAQSLRALARANEVRLGRSWAKHAIKDGRLSVSAALELECVQGMRIFDLLQAQRYWGSSGKKAMGVKAKNALSRLEISPYRRVQDLTGRQRVALLQEVDR